MTEKEAYSTKMWGKCICFAIISDGVNVGGHKPQESGLDHLGYLWVKTVKRRIPYSSHEEKREPKMAFESR